MEFLVAFTFLFEWDQWLKMLDAVVVGSIISFRLSWFHEFGGRTSAFVIPASSRSSVSQDFSSNTLLNCG
jgi:hypothetical protein